MHIPFADVAFKVGKDTDIQYLVLQVHYKDVSRFLPPGKKNVRRLKTKSNNMVSIIIYAYVLSLYPQLEM